MKINKIIAAALSVAIAGGTMPYIGCVSPESIITANAETESVFEGVKITDSKNADIYNGDKSKSFSHLGRTYYSGIVLSAKKDEKAFVEFDISDVKTFSCSARYLQTCYKRSDSDSVNVYVDDFLNEKWSFTKENNVSKNSKLRFEYSTADLDFVICDIVTDKGSSEAPVIPEYKSSLEFMNSGFFSQFTEVYTGEDKDKNFNVFGRTYSKGILLTAQASESMYAADKAARISFNVENVSKLKFSFARAITDDCGVDTIIRILNDSGQNMMTKLINKQGEKTSYVGIPVQGSNFIMECELDVSNTDIITFVYNNRLKDTYAITDISIDDMPAESGYTVPEYKDDSDFLKNGSYLNYGTDIYTGENKEKTFTSDGKAYDRGIVFTANGSKESNSIVYFNVENLDKISFVMRLKDCDKEPKAGMSPCSTVRGILISGDEESNVRYSLDDVDISKPVLYSIDVSDTSILSIDAFHIDDLAGELAITDIKLNPIDDENTSTTQPDNILYGDANCDSDISLADAVLIMQSLANPSKFSIDGDDKNKMTKNGLSNADCCNTGDGITNLDALAIQKYTLNLIGSLPENK